MQGEDTPGRNRVRCMWIRSSALIGKSLYEKRCIHSGCESSHRELTSEKERQHIGPCTLPESAGGQFSQCWRQMGLTATTGTRSPRGERPAVAEPESCQPVSLVCDHEPKKTSCQCSNLVRVQVNNKRCVLKWKTNHTFYKLKMYVSAKLIGLVVKKSPGA